MTSPSESSLIFGVLAAGAAFKAAAMFWLGKTRRKQFQLVGRVSALNVYPIKACRAVSVDHADCTNSGLRYHGVCDRHWMVVEENGSFLSQRKEPSMALIELTICDSQIEVSAPGMTTIKLPTRVPTHASKMLRCRLWFDSSNALDCGDEAAGWICKYLRRTGLRIVGYAQESAKRVVVNDPIPDWKTNPVPGDVTEFADYSPYLMTSESSLADVNCRLENPVTLRNFRPNIVVTGTQPFEEDNWKDICIGDAEFHNIASAPRCSVPTINPDTGVRDPTKEVTNVLNSFRLLPERCNNAPLFGVFIGLNQAGGIRVGDPVYVTVE